MLDIMCLFVHYQGLGYHGSIVLVVHGLHRTLLSPRIPRVTVLCQGGWAASFLDEQAPRKTTLFGPASMLVWCLQDLDASRQGTVTGIGAYVSM